MRSPAPTTLADHFALHSNVAQAAHDGRPLCLVQTPEPPSQALQPGRDCNSSSTGVISPFAIVNESSSHASEGKPWPTGKCHTVGVQLLDDMPCVAS
jgi:hypothetical protein